MNFIKIFGWNLLVPVTGLDFQNPKLLNKTLQKEKSKN